ncbi:MAG: Trk system potassium transporter TrkA [Halobacteriales archaeon]
MKFVIVGAGQVGTDIASNLSSRHDVTVVDQESDRVEEINYNVDALAVEGDGTTLECLREVGAGDADVLISSTDDDETNLVVCGSAKTLGDPFTIARVAHRQYQETWEVSPGAFGVDYIVAADVLTAESIVRIVKTPAAHDVDVFSEGKVLMAEFEVLEDGGVGGKTVAEADHYPRLTFAAVLRNGDVVIPGGDTSIEVGDKVIVIGDPDSVHEFAIEVAPDALDENDEVFVFGGSEIGFEVAQLLQDRGLEPRVVERDEERARWLAEELPGAVVFNSDATDREFLEREHVGDADVVVSALDNDERNLLSSLIADSMGAERNVAVVEHTQYVELFEAVGVDVAVNPREIVAEEIVRLTQNGHTTNLAFVGGEQAEVVEIEVDEDSVFAGRTLKEADADLPDGVVVGAVSRDLDFVVPRGDSRIEKGDHVIVFIDDRVYDEVIDRL